MNDLRTAAREAFVYTLPLIEVATTRQRGMGLGQTMGAFAHVRNLANHRHRAVTTPNTDTLYSTAHVDLSAGPVTITLPGMGDRYVSLALMDAYTNNFAILGTRTTGPDGAAFQLVAPREAADPGPSVIRSPTDHVLALARILVEGPHDLEAARAAQAGISMQGPASAMPGPYASRTAGWADGLTEAATLTPRTAGWAEYLASAAALMAANPPPPSDLKVLRAMAPLGLLDGFDPGRFTPGQVAEIEAGLAEGRALAMGGGGLGGSAFVDGWSYPAARLGDFGQDYALRCTVALGGLAALPPAEAMYMQAEGPGPRKLFDGTKAWRLHVPADAPIPVNSFWSLSLYEAMDDGQFFFTDNPLNRYAIGDRTPGLTANADGSLDIWIGHADPGGARSANWLPAPAGPFALFLRAYLPKPDLLDGRYRLPPVKPA